MENRIANTYSGVVTQLTQVKAGLDLYGTALGVALVQADDVTATLTALIAGDTAAKQAKTELVNRQKTLKTVRTSGRKFMTSARDVLKSYLGSSYSTVWEEAGFIGNYQVPRKTEKAGAVLLALNSYFTAHPTHENAPLGITAANAQLKYNDLVAARDAVNAQKTTWQLALASRDSATDGARDMVRTLIRELTGKLDPMDDRWTAFGLNKPGQLKTPPAPEKVTAVQSGPGLVVVKWGKTLRAGYYRVWKRVVGTDGEEFVFLGNTEALVFNIEGVAVGTKLDLAVSAVNNGGESVRSEVISVTVA